VEIQPGVPEVVHHVLVFIGGENVDLENTAGFLAAYVPGNRHQINPEGFAKWLPPGAELYFQMHYTPNGTATTDQTKLGLIFANEPPKYAILGHGIANDKIEIPPGEENHHEQAVSQFPTDVRLISFYPHMHVRGKSFRYELVHEGGQRETLLDVPRYDFNWQLEYRPVEPILVPKGTKIVVTGCFDNSDGNPANPDPSKTVTWGPQTDDEMLLGHVDYYVPIVAVSKVRLD
jgi:hypothetical protein